MSSVTNSSRHIKMFRMSCIFVHSSCNCEATSTPLSKPIGKATVSMRAALVQEIRSSAPEVVWAATSMPVWKSERVWSTLLLAGVQVRISDGREAQNVNAAEWLEKQQINLEADILPACETGNSRALAWHHNFSELVLGASYSVKVSETLQSEGTWQRLKKEQHQPHQGTHPVLICWWESGNRI